MKKRKLLRTFFLRAVLLLIGWIVLDFVYISRSGLNPALTNLVIDGTYFGLSALGYDTEVNGSILSIDRQQVALVQHGCNGLELFVLYAGFLICFPGKWLTKIIFIPVGIFLIYCINVLRVMALVLNYKFFEQTFDFNHKYTYVLIVYFFVFLLWRFWMNRFSVIAEKK